MYDPPLLPLIPVVVSPEPIEAQQIWPWLVAQERPQKFRVLPLPTPIRTGGIGTLTNREPQCYCWTLRPFMTGLITKETSEFLTVTRMMILVTTLMTSKFFTLNGSIVTTTTNLVTPEATFALIFSWHLIQVFVSSLLFDRQEKKNSKITFMPRLQLSPSLWYMVKVFNGSSDWVIRQCLAVTQDSDQDTTAASDSTALSCVTGCSAWALLAWLIDRFIRYFLITSRYNYMI